MGTENQGMAERIPRNGEACSYIEDIYMFGDYSKGIAIINATTVISTIDNHYKLRKIFEDLRLSIYDSWG